MTKEFLEKLKYYRNRQFPNMGIRAVALEVGVSFAHLNKIERGLIPSADYLTKLARAYNLSSEEEFELFVLANKIYDHPATKNYFESNPKKMEELEVFFRKIKKNE